MPLPKTVEVTTKFPMPKDKGKLKNYLEKKPKRVNWVATMCKMETIGSSFFVDAALFSAGSPSMWFTNITNSAAPSKKVIKALGCEPQFTYRMVTEKGKKGIRIWRIK
jgi:hypothetical protein